MSAVSVRGRPAATTTTSAARANRATSFVRVWHSVTVASTPFWESKIDSGRPTIWLRPITTTDAPASATPARRRSSTTPAGVHGTNAGRPSTMRPTFVGWKPSTSLAGSTASITSRSMEASGSGSCTRMPSTASSAFKARTAARTSALPADAGRWISREWMPAAAQAFSLAVTYEREAGSSPTSTTASPGTRPVAARKAATAAAVSARKSAARLFPSRMRAAMVVPQKR